MIRDRVLAVVPFASIGGVEVCLRVREGAEARKSREGRRRGGRGSRQRTSPPLQPSTFLSHFTRQTRRGTLELAPCILFKQHPRSNQGTRAADPKRERETAVMFEECARGGRSGRRTRALRVPRMPRIGRFGRQWAPAGGSARRGVCGRRKALARPSAAVPCPSLSLAPSNSLHPAAGDAAVCTIQHEAWIRPIFLIVGRRRGLVAKRGTIAAGREPPQLQPSPPSFFSRRRPHPIAPLSSNHQHHHQQCH